MPRRDDEYEDDDKPRRRSRGDDELNDEPPRRRRFEDEDDRIAPPPRKKSGNLVLILGIVGAVLLVFCVLGGGALYFIFSKVGDAAERAQSSNNLKQMALACHNYHDTYTTFPNNSYGPDGKPLLSWRVHILPYVEQDNLYKQFKLNEPWDSPNNIRLLSQMPRIYARPVDAKTGTMGDKTYYRGFSSPGAIFARRDGFQPNLKDKKGFEPPIGIGPPIGIVQMPKGVRTNEIVDGTTNTILIVEAGTPVEWTKPDDLDASPGKPFPPLGGVRPNSDVVICIMADAQIRMIKKTISETQWRGAVTYAGGEVVILD